MTRSIDAPAVKVGRAEVVLEATVVEAGGGGTVEVTVEVDTLVVEALEVTVEVDTLVVEALEEAGLEAGVEAGVEEAGALGVVRVETIPLPLTGYYQQVPDTRPVPAKRRRYKRARGVWRFPRSRTFGRRRQ
jgi:hypothetical protein